ncbi:MAG: hypothetical protein AAF597_04710 [Bacteroidota bacterium]
MLLLKSTLLSLTTLLVASSSPMASHSVEQVDTEYCYDVTLNITLPGGIGSAAVTVSACGDTPSEGLFALGVAVRQAYVNQGPQQ